MELEREPDRLAGAQADALSGALAEPLANELTRGQALRFGALLHDIAKPQTREVTPQGRVTFMGHDGRGAELSAAILGRLRASERLREHVAALTRHHLRLGFLVHEMPLEPPDHLRLPARDLAGRRRRHRAQRRRPAGDAGGQLRAGHRPASGAGAPDAGRGARLGGRPAAPAGPRATSWSGRWGSGRGRSSAACWRSWRRRASAASWPAPRRRSSAPGSSSSRAAAESLAGERWIFSRR